jgi:hypothetical protein
MNERPRPLDYAQPNSNPGEGIQIVLGHIEERLADIADVLGNIAGLLKGIDETLYQK